MNAKWKFPSDTDIKNEWDWEYTRHIQGKNSDWDLWPDFPSFKKAVKQAKKVQVTPALDSRIDYRSNERSLESLKDLVSGYQYPRDVDRIVRGFQKGEPIPYPMVLKNGSDMRVLGGNTRMDVAFILHINPVVLMIEPPKRTNESMKLKKILEDIHVPLKKGDTVLVGKFKNHPIKVKSIGKGDDNMPTINGKPAVKFRLPKKEGKLTEMPHGESDSGAFDLQIEKYPLPDHQKKALLQAYNSDTGVWGYSKKYDTIVIFKRTGVMVSPKGGVAQTEPATSAKPQSLDGGVPGGNNNNKLPADWERFIIGKY